ncbi:transglutaminase-like domain-containing protein [Runella zeae]|uniref:transglutaminase-like domain-containing protein n=1 Tax=Runella zeae TaxID=94255 RepID=UPI0023561E68|nr:transglutaminase-like domain-containing protein [Runella zeae]
MSNFRICLYLSWIAFSYVMLAGCGKNSNADPLEHNLELAGDNRPELEKVLIHYRQNPNDSLKLKAAIILLSNIEKATYYDGPWLTQYNAIFANTAPLVDYKIKALKDSLISKIVEKNDKNLFTESDLKSLKSAFFIEHIDLAFAAWQSAPWYKSVSFESFCNYILPYRNFSEPPTIWRKELRARYDSLMTSKYDTSMQELTCRFNEELITWFKYSIHFDDYPGRIDINNLLRGKRGNCSDMANLAAYIGRSYGIPIAIDYTPQWANHTAGHVWNALVINQNEFLPFLGAEDSPGDYYLFTRGESKPAKVYRKNLIKVDSSFAVKAERLGIEESELPIYLRNARALDVTHFYTPTGDVELDFNVSDDTPVYLCIFQRNNWQAIGGGFVKDKKALFKNMGRGILYMPMFYKKGSYEAAGAPIIFPLEGDPIAIRFDSSKRESMLVERKYPLKRTRSKLYMAEFYRYARFEGANTPDFKDATLLYTIENPMEKWVLTDVGGYKMRDNLQYESLWEEATIKSQKAFRYVRLAQSFHESIKVGELEFFAPQSSAPLNGTAIGSVPNPHHAFDGVPGNSIVLNKQRGEDHWVGLDLGTSTTIAKVRYLPVNDNNKILPSRTYELFYWDEYWKPLAKQKAKEHTITFQNVPSNGLYWLHCRDCNSTEERPFRIVNGIQEWW